MRFLLFTCASTIHTHTYTHIWKGKKTVPLFWLSFHATNIVKYSVAVKKHQTSYCCQSVPSTMTQKMVIKSVSFNIFSSPDFLLLHRIMNSSVMVMSKNIQTVDASQQKKSCWFSFFWINENLLNANHLQIIELFLCVCWAQHKKRERKRECNERLANFSVKHFVCMRVHWSKLLFSDFILGWCFVVIFFCVYVLFDCIQYSSRHLKKSEINEPSFWIDHYFFFCWVMTSTLSKFQNFFRLIFMAFFSSLFFTLVGITSVEIGKNGEYINIILFPNDPLYVYELVLLNEQEWIL